MPSATGRALQNHASAAHTVTSAAGNHKTGSRSAARLSATPPMAATGIHRKKRRLSISSVSAAENSARQSGAHIAGRTTPVRLAPLSTRVRAGVAIRL